jgi:hypothetical protein
MSRTPIDPSLIHGPDESCNLDELFTSLAAHVRPHLTPHIAAHVTAEIRGVSLSEEEIRMLMHALGEALVAQGATRAELKAELKAARARLRDPSSIPDEELEEVITEATDEALTVLLSAWGNVLVITSVETDTDISLAGLDDCMLPPLGEELGALFAEACEQANLTVDQARDVLRATKAALPAGHGIPEAMTAILAHEGVCVTD